jgi:hypothetical protein
MDCDGCQGFFQIGRLYGFIIYAAQSFVVDFPTIANA